MSLQQTSVPSMEKVAIKSSADYENAGGFLLPKSVVCYFVGFFFFPNFKRFVFVSLLFPFT